jgi:hypothetical protein
MDTISNDESQNFPNSFTPSISKDESQNFPNSFTPSISKDELIRRMVWLANKFPNYKTKFYVFDHSDISDDLDDLEIDHEEYYGPLRGTDDEDIADYAIFLNVGKTEVLDFSYDIEKNNMVINNFHISNEMDMLNLIFQSKPPASLIIGNAREFVREIMMNVFGKKYTESIMFILVKKSNKRYRMDMKNENMEYVNRDAMIPIAVNNHGYYDDITTEYDVTIRKTKKIKLC